MFHACESLYVRTFLGMATRPIQTKSFAAGVAGLCEREDLQDIWTDCRGSLASSQTSNLLICRIGAGCGFSQRQCMGSGDTSTGDSPNLFSFSFIFQVLPYRPLGQALEPRHLCHPEHRAGGGGGLAALHQGPRGQKSQGAAQTRGDALVSSL